MGPGTIVYGTASKPVVPFSPEWWAAEYDRVVDLAPIIIAPTGETRTDMPGSGESGATWWDRFRGSVMDTFGPAQQPQPAAPSQKTLLMALVIGAGLFYVARRV